MSHSQVEEVEKVGATVGATVGVTAADRKRVHHGGSQEDEGRGQTIVGAMAT